MSEESQGAVVEADEDLNLQRLRVSFIFNFIIIYYLITNYVLHFFWGTSLIVFEIYVNTFIYLFNSV